MSLTANGSADTGTDAVVREVVAAHRGERGPLMEVLHDVQARVGWVSPESVQAIAAALNLSVAEVHGVVSFYHDFRTEPPAAHRVALCRGEACQSVGAEALYDATRARSGSLGAGVDVGEVFCLGNCALGPSGMLDGRLHGRLSTERLDALTEGWR